MEQITCFEDYPISTVILSVTFSIIIYGIGIFILSGFGILWGILFLIYAIIMELLLLKKSCVNCYYYGKICAFGRGKICALFFKKGDSKRFVERHITWRDMIPDFLFLIIPLIGGIILLVMNFNWLLLVLLVILVFLFFVGNGVIRGSLACKFCKQREIGCPALKVFQKE